MSKLTDVLDRFNRKERNLLVRNLLGHSAEKGLRLTDSFRERVEYALKITVPADAWWATDYHLNWIAGAVAVWRDGKQANSKTYNNDKIDGTPARHLVEPSQEDADLLIAFDQTLILVEVKAFGNFTNKQVNSKMQRWTLLNEFCKAEPKGPNLTLHFMLMSRTKPIKLDPPPPKLSLYEDKWPHALLHVPSASEKLKVTGKGPDVGAPASASNKWCVVRVSAAEDRQNVAIASDAATDFDLG